MFLSSPKLGILCWQNWSNFICELHKESSQEKKHIEHGQNFTGGMLQSKKQHLKHRSVYWCC